MLIIAFYLTRVLAFCEGIIIFLDQYILIACSLPCLLFYNKTEKSLVNKPTASIFALSAVCNVFSICIALTILCLLAELSRAGYRSETEGKYMTRSKLYFTVCSVIYNIQVSFLYRNISKDFVPVVCSFLFSQKMLLNF